MAVLQVGQVHASLVFGMLMRLTDLSKAFVYYTIALGLCLGIAWFAPRLGERTPNLAMFTPLAAVLIMLLLVTRDGYSRSGWKALGVHRAGLRGWRLAFILPLLVLSFSYGGVWLSGVAAIALPAQFAGVPLFVLDLVLSIAVVAVVGGIAEEIGWRGYLLPRLMGLGLRPALLLSGLLHGLWHLPVMPGKPFYHPQGNRIIVVGLFLPTLAMAGVCYGYLRLTTASVWPAAIAHSTFNVGWERFNAFTVTDSPVALEYWAGESGILTLIALVVAAGWLAFRLRVRPLRPDDVN